jgi:hypothetical protein
MPVKWLKTNRESSTARKIRVIQKEGNRDASRDWDFYNLDAIIAVGYRVNSQATPKPHPFMPFSLPNDEQLAKISGKYRLL